MRRRLPLTLCLTALAAALLAAPVQAKVVHPLEASFDGAATPAGSFDPYGVAVDPSSHDLYVSDFAHKAIDRFSATGAYLCQITGEGESSSSPSECDSSEPGPGALGNGYGQGIVESGGAFLFPDFGARAIDRFGAAGAFLPPQLAVPDSGGPVQVALDASGNLYVADFRNRRVEKYTTSTSTWSAFATGVPAGPFGSGAPAGVAVDTDPTSPSFGYVYVADPANQAIDVFEPSGAYAAQITETPEGPLSTSLGKLAVDPSDGHLFVPDAGNGTLDEFAPGGVFVSQTPVPAAPGPSSPQGVAVDPSTAAVFVADGANDLVDVFASHVVPVAETRPVTALEEGAATLNGHLDPDGGGEITSCQFEYGEDASYGQTTPCSPGPPYAGPADVSAALSGLTPNTAYHYRLVAANANEVPSHGEDAAFGPPLIGGELAIARTRGATVKAQIDPFGHETTCEVQYADDASFQASGYAGAASAPCAGALPAGFGEQTATATLNGLEIATTYHFRFVAHNAAGTTVGADRQFATFAIESFSIETLDAGGEPYSQAGGHPYMMRVSFDLSTTASVGEEYERGVSANLRTVRVQLPPGLIGNPTATPRCPAYKMQSLRCPPGAQVGSGDVIAARTGSGSSHGTLYNLDPPEGVAAQIGGRFNIFGTVRIDARVRSGSDYGIDADTLSVTADDGIEGVKMTLWGVPADASHDGERPCAASGCSSGAPLLPFLTNPTSCSGPLAGRLAVDTWQDPGNFTSKRATLPPFTGCNQLDFTPTLEARPTTDVSDSPSGLNVDLHLPQNDLSEACEPGPPAACGKAEAHLKDVTVTLPEGLVINPSGANGLGACSAAQIGYKPGSVGPAEFSPEAAHCPDASRIGEVEVDTPLLDHPLPGSVYLAAPHDNPFDSMLAIYIAIHDPASGVVVKLPGHVTTDPRTGRLATTFEESPQLPFEDFKLRFFKGAAAPLMTPPTCGVYATTSAMSSWAGQSASPRDEYAISRGPSGGCASKRPDLPNSPSFEAGTIAPIAGAGSPFVLNLSRGDGSQRISRIDTVLPQGLVGRLAGVPYCPQAAIDAAASKPGRDEQSHPSCPSASAIGSVSVAAGAGPAPYHAGGTVYLAGPYRGAPVSVVVITPAVAGPFDLGTVVTRAALHVDPVTAQITAKSDPIPQTLVAGGNGFPLDVRSIHLRTEITRNPTSCEPAQVGGTAFSALGAAASLAQRFQVGECRALAFKPKLYFRLWGKTRRGANPKLRAVLKMPKSGQANVARTAVTLPRSEFLDQAHIRTVCTRVQYAAGSGGGEKCPRGSIYGYARAWSPLLDKPLQGPIYLRSSSHKLPDMVASLDGQIHVDLDGRIDSHRGGIRTIFAAVPDAPVSTFVLYMKGGRRGLLQNSTNICRGAHRALARFAAHNGRLATLRPALSNSRCRRRHRKAHRHHRGRRARVARAATAG